MRRAVAETVSLKEHFGELLKEKDRALGAAMAAAKEATTVAEVNSEKWRANANEWRAAMDDREKKFVTVAVFDPFRISIDKELGDIKAILQTMQGRKQGLGEGWGYLVGAIGLIVTFLNIVDRITP